jgi:hypothetical protein
LAWSTISAAVENHQVERPRVEGLRDRRLARLGGDVGQAVLAQIGHDECQARRDRAERLQSVAQVDRGHLAVETGHAARASRGRCRRRRPPKAMAG